jgi:hypothetical protein
MELVYNQKHYVLEEEVGRGGIVFNYFDLIVK